MFFSQNDLKIDIISVLSLNRTESSGFASGRQFHALSFRKRGNADFVHEDISLHAADGDVLYVPKNYDYRTSAKNEELIVVHFDILDTSSELDAELFEFDLLSLSEPDYFEGRFKKLYELWTKKQNGYRYECAAVMYKLLAALHREKCGKRFENADFKIAECVDYIHRHFTDRELSVALLSSMAGMSDTYFRKLFLSSLGKTPLKYITELKVSYATELLSSGYYSVSEVAEKAGFESPKYLSAVVKKSTGFSPVHFKNGKAF